MGEGGEGGGQSESRREAEGKKKVMWNERVEERKIRKSKEL